MIEDCLNLKAQATGNSGHGKVSINPKMQKCIRKRSNRSRITF